VVVSRHRKTYAVFLALILAQAVASLVLPRGFSSTLVGDLIQSICLLLGLVFAASNIRSTHGRLRGFWTLVSLGFGFWLAFQFLWNYFEVILRQEVPNPFVGDIILFLHIVPMTAALAVEPHAGRDEPAFRLSSLDFLLLFIWWLYLYLFAVVPWQYVFANDALYDHAWNVLYLTEKVIFLGWLGVLWARSTDAWQRFYGHWFSATVLYAASSYIANVAIERHWYYTGSFYDVPLVVSLAWLAALGLLSPQTPVLNESSNKSSEEQNVWSPRLAMLAMLSLPIFVAWSAFGGNAPASVRQYRQWLTVGTMIVMGLLVFVKQHILDRDLLRLLRSSRESLADLRRAQTQLVQSEKLAALGQLVAGVAHELNNPLTAIIGYSQLLVETTPLSPQQQSLTERLWDQVNRVRVLVSGLLSFAKQMPMVEKTITLNSVIHTAVKLCKSDPKARTIRVEVNLRPDLPPIRGDSNQLLQVFLHILRNGVDAAQGIAGGAIGILAERRGDSVIVEFSDNGPGIAEPQRVFDPFYTNKPVGKGAGLGLSACYGIIQEHRGRIWCQNRSEGGALFGIEFPVKSDGAEVDPVAFSMRTR